MRMMLTTRMAPPRRSVDGRSTGRVTAVLLAALLSACNGGDGKDGDPTDGIEPSETGTTDTDETPVTDAVTFAEDLRPLIGRSCAHCHGESGLAPVDLTDFDVASAWAEVMLERIDSGEMPPPTADPACHPYQGMASMVIDPELRGVLAQWIEDGKQPGDLAGVEPVEPWTPPTLSRRDVELRPPAAVLPQFVDGNEYRCFLIDDSVDADTWIAGFEFLMDSPSISHHAVLFIDPNGGSEARITDQASQSWTCPSVQPEANWQTVHAWAPSGGAVEFPDGMGLRLRAGQQLIMQMHYWAGADGPVEDLPGYALKLVDDIDREMLYLPFGPDSFVIPAGAPAHTETSSVAMLWLGGAYDVFGVMPHMHVLGVGYDFVGTTAEGAETCISRSDAYDFALQPTYWFDEPVRLEATDRLDVSCTWDNSAANPRQLNDPPIDVSWGENTQQEMCYALMYASPAQ
jgi:hypothetical protein